MSRILLSLVIVLAVVTPCQAQFFKKLGQELLQGASGQQTGAQGQSVGSTSIPPGRYMVTNLQTCQAFYLTVESTGQMFAASPYNQQQGGMPGSMLSGQQTLAPAQQIPQGGSGSGMQNFLQNGIAPIQQNPARQPF